MDFRSDSCHGFSWRQGSWHFIALGLLLCISFDILRQHRDALPAWVDTHAVLAVMLVLYKKVKGPRR
jgi:hypothetical protein